MILAFRIIATVFIGISYFSMAMKNILLLNDVKTRFLVMWTTWGMIWRTFYIVAVWLI